MHLAAEAQPACAQWVYQSMLNSKIAFNHSNQIRTPLYHLAAEAQPACAQLSQPALSSYIEREKSIKISSNRSELNK
jgi:hypothetical protein